jgi:hypothetical protein
MKFYLRQDLNDSTQFSKTRHISLNRGLTNPQEQFVNDVFDLFDLDFDEYLNSVGLISSIKFFLIF